jgi:hypothetical protein
MGSEQHETNPGVIVPKSLGGKWIAWNSVGDSIIASGETLKGVMDAARATEEVDPSFEKVPPANVRLVGVVR